MKVIAITISIVIGVVQGSAESNKFGENPVISNNNYEHSAEAAHENEGYTNPGQGHGRVDP